MDSILSNASTRIFTIYGELSDRFCMPNTQIMNFEEFLAMRLHDLGYEHILFCSIASNYFYAVDDVSTNAFDVLNNKKTTQNTGTQNQPTAKPNPWGEPSPALQQSAQTVPATEKSKPKSYTTNHIDENQLIVSTNRFMNDTTSSKVLVFTSIEDILNLNDEKFASRFSENLENWKTLPEENRNICILLARTLDIETLTSDINNRNRNLMRSLFLEDTTINKNAAINIGMPLNDEIGNLLEAFRLTGVTFKTADHNDYTVRLLFNYDEKQELTRALSFYSRSRGLKQLKDIIIQLQDYMWEYVKAHRVMEVRITPKDIAAIYSDSDMSSELDKDPLEAIKNTEGWEPAYNVLNSYIQTYRTTHTADETAKEEITDKTLNVDRFEPSMRKDIRGKVPNFVLQGPPGVGKTEIAQLIGRILQREGILKSGHTVIASRDTLVGQYVGETSPKTKSRIEEAQEGVLLIDEVYSLAEKRNEHNNSFCNEVFDTLVAAMTNPKYHFCVVFSGYADKMNDVMNMNSGLQSRFGLSNIITLESYKPPLLEKIFRAQFGKPEGPAALSTELSEEIVRSLPTFFENYYEGRSRDNFGNARDVKNLADEVKRSANYRYISNNDISPEDVDGIKTIYAKKCDFGDKLSLFEKKGLSTEEIYRSLDDYIGLDFLKRMFDDQLAIKIECMEKGTDYPGPSHMIWAGNPGTGKSTAAKLTADLLCSLGILGSKTPIYVDASEILSTYVGGLAKNMNDKIDEACDKHAVLILEEAYQLLGRGDEAIHAMLNRMETDRKNFTLIIVLYKDKVEDFLNRNPGLRSRMLVYEFNDYDAKQLNEIFRLMCRKSKDIIDGDCAATVKETLDTLYKEGRTSYGNARIVRQLHEKMMQARFRRINSELAERFNMAPYEVSDARIKKTLPAEVKRDYLYTFTAHDVPTAEELRQLYKSREEIDDEKMMNNRLFVGG